MIEELLHEIDMMSRERHPDMVMQLACIFGSCVWSSCAVSIHGIWKRSLVLSFFCRSHATCLVEQGFLEPAWIRSWLLLQRFFVSIM